MNILFMGTPQPAVPTLEKILERGHKVVAVWTQPDRPSGRGQRLKASPVKELAVSKGLPVFQPEKLKTKETIELFRSCRADVAVVVAYGRILTKSYLNAFRYDPINVHFSLLPKYRGAAPVNWAIVNGEKTTGVTTMKMDRGLDAGDILLQTETRIGEDETAIDLMNRLSILGADLLGQTLDALDGLKPRAQNHAEATYARLLLKDDGLIDWNMTSFEINNRIRGFQPFPKSFSALNRQKITIWKGEPFETPEAGGEPAGQILEADGQNLIVSCGGGTALRITELQLEGKRRMSSSEFLNGVKLNVGEVLV